MRNLQYHCHYDGKISSRSENLSIGAFSLNSSLVKTASQPFIMQPFFIVVEPILKEHWNTFLKGKWKGVRGEQSVNNSKIHGKVHFPNEKSFLNILKCYQANTIFMRSFHGVSKSIQSTFRGI